MVRLSSLYSELVDEWTTEPYCRVPYRVSFVYVYLLMRVSQSCDEPLVVCCGAGGRYPDWQKAITG
jgi:hypothetical protein